MASTKISALPGATTLTGAESIPLVQGGTTKKVTSDQFLIKDASGNVGVGTASPLYRVSVAPADKIGYSNGSSYGYFEPYSASGNMNFMVNWSGGSTESITFGTAGNERMRIDGVGNLGLGVTPSAWGGGRIGFDVGNITALFNDPNGAANLASNAYWNGTQFVYKITAAASRYEAGLGTYRWFTAPSGTAGNAISFTQAMTLDASGNLGIGTASPSFKLDVSGGIGDGIRYTATNGIRTVMGEGSGAGFVGTTTNHSLALWTNGTAKATIDASGNLLVGATATGVSSGGVALIPNSGNSCVGIGHATGTASGEWYETYRYAGTAIGSITQSGTTAVLFNTSSDARLKENVAAADNGSALIDGLQVRQFNWKSDGSHQRYGFVAQELDAVYPEAVSKPADPDEMMGVDYSKLVPLLVQEIQSLRARVAALETV